MHSMVPVFLKSILKIPPNFIFVFPVSYLTIIFPISCNVKFSLLFVLFVAVKTDSKLTEHHIGNFLLFTLTEIKFKIRRVTFLEVFLPQRHNWMEFRLSENKGNIECTQIQDELQCLNASG